MKKFFALTIFTLIMGLCACSNQANSDDQPKTENYNKVDEQYNYNWTLGVTPEKEEYNLGTLLISVNEDIPLNLTFGFSGAGEVDKITDAQIKIYYDYKPISFKLNENDEFNYDYNYDMKNHKSYTFKLYLNPNEIIQDDMIHKLFITITTGNDKYAKDLNFSNDAYGVSTIYDLVHSENYTDEVYVKAENFPTNNTFKKVTDSIYAPNTLAVNQDNDIEDGIARNLPNYDVLEHNKIDFKAYISNLSEQEDHLVLINLNFNLFSTIYIPTDGDVGTYGGDISLEVSDSEKIYEYTAYTIVNPFEKIIGAEYQFTKLSNRFTITNE